MTGLVGRHPEEYQLADYLDGGLSVEATASIREHLSSCVACRSIVDAAAQDLLDRRAPADLVVDATLPESMRVALTSTQTTSALQAGQLWRLRADKDSLDETVCELGVIVKVEDDVLVAPVTVDTQTATDLWTVQLPVDGTPLTIAVWASLETPVGAEVLDVLLGTVDPQPVLALHHALRRGELPPRGLRLGRPLDAELQSHRESIRSRFTVLSKCRLVGSVWDDWADEHGEAPTVDLPTAVKKAGWGLPELAAATGLNLRDSRLFLEGRSPLTAQQAARLSNALGYGEPLRSAPPNPGWVRAIATPRRRARFERVAAETGVPGWEFRSEQAHYALAARGNTERDADWEALAEQRLLQLEAAAGLVD